MKLWGGRFSKNTNQVVNEYNASIGFDNELAEFDIQGSLAHVKMLGYCKILPHETVQLITDGLQKIRQQLHEGILLFDIADEDIHMNIERLLHQLIGPEAGKLHTGRSRNDQVALDTHLYLRFHSLQLIEQLKELNATIIQLAETHLDVIIPGYTHLQRAEPVRFSHHMLAYFNMFYRDTQRLMNNFPRVNICPLGAGALAGSGVAIDRNYVAELLHFDAIYENSLDAVSDRDFIVEFLAAASLIMMHFSKLSEEIILWSSHEFAFIELDDAFCTGSSMMPQKKNPDVAELARGKVGRVYGSLMSLLTVLKGLPLAYNKDLQEDKEGLFDAVKTLRDTLTVYPLMLNSIKLNKNKLQQTTSNDYSNATQLANYMVSKGLAFRMAHEITGKIVLYCIDKQCMLNDLSLVEYQQFYPQIASDIYQFISVEQVVEAHKASGGTAKASVIQQIAAAKIKQFDIAQWLERYQILLDI